MNVDDARRVLREVACLTQSPYGVNKIAAWSEALSDVPAEAALRAVRGLVTQGTHEVTVPAIRGFLRAERDAERRSLSITLAPRACECTSGKLCDHHRGVNLAGLAEVRRLHPRLFPPPKEST